jgi:hypothetical protein
VRSPCNMQESYGRSPAGGTIGVNGFFYKGGRFLPSTETEPGRWKIGKKWVTSSRELIAPGELAYQPTPFSRSLFKLIGVGSFTRMTEDGGIVLYRGSDGRPVGPPDDPYSMETRIRPGVAGVLGKEDFSLQELIDLWMDGARWIDVKPDVERVMTL